jgi:hypothetical protein
MGRINNQAMQLFVQGRPADAEPLLKRSLAIREKTLGPNNLEVATSLSNLAALPLKSYYRSTPPVGRGLRITRRDIAHDPLPEVPPQVAIP